MSYTQGDTVVHPQHGAAVVEAIVTKDLGDGPIEYLDLYVDFVSLRILVPAESVERIGIRSLSSKQEAEAILAVLEEQSDVPVQWAERNTSTMSRMKSRQLDQIAMVVRDLMQHQRRIDKPLSTGEQSALTSCVGILARELSLSLGTSEDEVAALLAEKGSGGQG